jgi:hypothetical protein
LATVPEISRMPRSRWSVHLAIAVVPKITPTPEKTENPQKPLLLIFLEILLIF